MAYIMPKILIADDSRFQVQLLASYLGKGFEVTSASDALQAWMGALRSKPDVILLDLLMPRLDGFGVLSYLHHTPSYRDIPVIVLTAKTCTAEEQALLHARVRTVIQKQGLERDGLLQEVRAALLAYRATTEEA